MDFDIYCDECFPDLFCSEKPQARYALIGSLWLPTAKRSEFKAAIHGLRDRYKVGGEIKSRKVSPSRIEFYKALCDWFFDQGDDLRFRVITIESQKLNLLHFHGGDAELGFYKFYYQLLTHWINPGNRYAVFCDYQTNQIPTRLHEMKSVLRKTNPLSEILDVQWVRSPESVLTQLTDVLTGLASARLNGTVQAGSAKSELLSHLESRLDHPVRSTHAGELKFNVFNIRLEGGW